MQTTTVSQLKMSLSTYLRQVKAGEEVVITRIRPSHCTLIDPSRVLWPSLRTCET